MKILNYRDRERRLRGDERWLPTPQGSESVNLHIAAPGGFSALGQTRNGFL